jgi:hypothetical protein
MTFNPQTDPPPARDTHSFGRIAVVVVLASLALGVWRLVLTPVGVHAVCDPPQLVPDGVSQSRLRVEMVNRIGTAIPFTHTPLRVAVLEGAGLLEITYTDDGTTALLTAGTEPGVVELKIMAEGWPLPLVCRVVLETPMARARGTHPEKSAGIAGTTSRGTHPPASSFTTLPNLHH